MSSDRVQVPFYVVGTPHPNTNTHPTVETKPTATKWDRTPDDFDPTTRSKYDTGGGYEHARSREWRPHTSRREKESVYASIHRLCAVAWCFPDGATAEDIDLRGMDVHHTHPGDWPCGVEWLNIHDSPNLPDAGLEVMGHGEHSEVTNATMKAWAEDARRSVEQSPEPDRCPACDAEPETWATSPDVEGHECLRCVTRKTDDGAIEVGR